MAKAATASKRPAKKPAGAKARTAKKRPSTRQANRASRPKGNTVAVLGGGISGMTAALKLARAGFDVTIFEMQERLGGNTSSREINGVEHDVYPHMFCSWYDNFWHLFEEELGCDREAMFEPRAGSKVLQKGETEFKTLLNATSIEAVIENLKSGVLSPAEMWLLGYSALDLAAYPFNRKGAALMDMLSVNGFIFSRGYATEDVAAMQNYLLTLIWSIPSAWTAAATYQNFLRHTFSFPNHAPFNYLMKASLEDGLNAPFVKALEDAGCSIRLKTEITAVRLCDDDDRPEIFSRSSIKDHLKHDSDRIEKNGNPIGSEMFDYAVMSLPVTKCCDMILGAPRGRKGRRIVDRLPELAEMQKLSSVSIPVVDLYLNRKLEDFPRDHIALAGSKYGLTVLDISELWEGEDFDGKTALVLAASEGSAIPSVELERQGELMLQEFAEFFPGFDPGKHWGDADSDVDWHKSWIRSNKQYQLFLNDTGSWGHRPQTLYEDKLPRFVFAGDCVRTEVDMATVESAIQGGTQAAAAIQAQDARLNGHAPRGEPIKLIPHTIYSTATFRFAALFYLPATYAAYAVAAYEQWKKRDDEGDTPLGENEFSMAENCLLIPLQFTIDWWKGVYWFGRSLVHENSEEPLGGPATYLPSQADPTGNAPGPELGEMVDPEYDDDHFIGLPEAILKVAREVVEYASGRENPHGRDEETGTDDSHDPVDDVVDIAVDLIGKGLKLGESLVEGYANRRSAKSGPRRRRHRVKR